MQATNTNVTSNSSRITTLENKKPTYSTGATIASGTTVTENTIVQAVTYAKNSTAKIRINGIDVCGVTSDGNIGVYTTQTLYVPKGSTITTTYEGGYYAFALTKIGTF